MAFKVFHRRKSASRAAFTIRQIIKNVEIWHRMEAGRCVGDFVPKTDYDKLLETCRSLLEVNEALRDAE